MHDTILRKLKAECLALALAGKCAGVGALPEMFSELEAAGCSSPAFFELSGPAFKAAGSGAGLPELNRLVSAILAAGADYGHGSKLEKIPSSRISTLSKQLSFRRLVESRLALEAGGASADRRLKRLLSTPEVPDLRLIPSLKKLSDSQRATASRMAASLLERVYSDEDPDSERVERARAYLAAGDIENLSGAVWILADVFPMPRAAMDLALELLQRLPEFIAPSLEFAVVCVLAAQRNRESLEALENALENIRSPRAVFSLAFDTYTPEELYARFSGGFQIHCDRHYAEFRDALVCHVTRGGCADSRWSDYFASKYDLFPTLLTVGPGCAHAINYLRSFRLSGGVPTPAELLLNLALVPQALLRMEIYDFWDALWKYLKNVIAARAKDGKFSDTLFNERVIFTLSLNGGWIIDKLAELAGDSDDCPQVSRLIERIYEMSCVC